MAYATFETAAPSEDRRRVRVGELISGAWRALMEARGQLLLPWLALTVMLLVMRLGGQYLGIDPAKLLQTPSGLVITCATAVASSVILAGVIRTLLGRREDAWDMDGGAIGFIVINVAVTTAFAVTIFAMQPPADQTDKAVMVAYGMRVLGVFGAMLALAIAGLGLTLFPLGVLMRDAEITVGRAWSLMRGAKFSYTVAVFVLSLGPGFLSGFFTGFGRTFGGGALSLPFVALSVASTGLLTLCAAAVQAELFRLRAGDTRYGEVFD